MDISETGIVIKHNGKEIVLDLADHIEMDIQVWNIHDSLDQCQMTINASSGQICIVDPNHRASIGAACIVIM